MSNPVNAEYERNTRRAREQMGQDIAQHYRNTGTALPDSRAIEARVTEIARRNDRRDSEVGNRRQRGC